MLRFDYLLKSLLFLRPVYIASHKRSLWQLRIRLDQSRAWNHGLQGWGAGVGWGKRINDHGIKCLCIYFEIFNILCLRLPWAASNLLSRCQGWKERSHSLPNLRTADVLPVRPEIRLRFAGYRWFSEWRHQIVKSKERGFTNSCLH